MKPEPRREIGYVERHSTHAPGESPSDAAAPANEAGRPAAPSDESHPHARDSFSAGTPAPRFEFSASTPANELARHLDSINLSDAKETQDALSQIFHGDSFSVPELTKRQDLNELETLLQKASDNATTSSGLFNRLFKRGNSLEGLLSGALQQIGMAKVEQGENTQAFLAESQRAGYSWERLEPFFRRGIDMNSKPLLHLVISLEGGAGRGVGILQIIKAGADVNSKNSDGNTPLHSALNAHVPREVISWLLQAGARANVTDRNQRTPLQLAARNGDLGAIFELSRAGADLNAKDLDGDTALHQAVAANRPDVVSALIAGGADLSAKNANGETAKEFATKLATRPWHGFRGDIRFRLEEAEMAKSMGEVLDPSQESHLSSLPSDIRTVIADYAVKKGGSALVTAVRTGDVALLKRLIDAGQQVNPPRRHSFTPRTDVYTPLMQAVESNNAEAVRALLAPGPNRANADDRFNGKIAMQLTTNVDIRQLSINAFMQQSAAVNEALKAKYGLDDASLDFQREVLGNIQRLPVNERGPALQRLVYDMNQVLLDKDDASRFASNMDGFSADSLVDLFQPLASTGWSLLKLAPSMSSLDPNEGSTRLLGFDEMRGHVNDLREQVAARRSPEDLKQQIEQAPLHPFDRQVLSAVARYLAQQSGNPAGPVSNEEQGALKLLYEHVLGLPYGSNSLAPRPTARPAAELPTEPADTGPFQGTGAAAAAPLSESERSERDLESLDQKRARMLARFASNT